MHPRRTGLWRHADFLRLWAGQTTSQFGSLVGGVALQFTAILWLHAGAAQVSLLAACQFAPAAVCGLFAGAWVDRLRRRPLMIAADSGRALALASVPLTALLGSLSLPQLYAVACLNSGLGVLFESAYEAYLPTLLPAEQIVAANSTLTASASVAEFGAFSAGGWLVQLFSSPATVLIDALSFGVSAASLAAIRAPEGPPPAPEQREPLRREITEGARTIWRQPLLRALAGVHMLLECGGRIIGAVILLYLSREAGFGAGAQGMIFAIGGLTALAGAAAAGRERWFGGLGRALTVAVLLRVAGIICVALTTSVSLLGVLLLVASQCISDPGYAFFEINAVSLRQTVTPAHLLGRVSATLRVLDFAAMLAGTALAGVLGQLIGLQGTLFVATGVVAGAALALMLSPIARLHTMPEPPALARTHGRGLSETGGGWLD
ncbi:MAG TPA: MFS transporter [Dehalococcoidia bacterium]|nr:MFS transporter [Dehalococcoidia bacterium]